MKANEKSEMKNNYGKLKKMINRVMDYNLKHDVHIFIDVSPHIEMVSFRHFLTYGRKWSSELKDVRNIDIYYSGILQNVEQGIKDLESWLTEK